MKKLLFAFFVSAISLCLLTTTVETKATTTTTQTEAHSSVPRFDGWRYLRTIEIYNPANDCETHATAYLYYNSSSQSYGFAWNDYSIYYLEPYHYSSNNGYSDCTRRFNYYHSLSNSFCYIR